METQEIQKFDAIPVNVQEANTRAEVDITVTTAKANPRNLQRAMENAKLEITLSNDAAETAGYSLKRSGSVIEGKSTHLASIAASHYGNLRVKTYIKAIEEKRVIAEAACWDIENNYWQSTEVTRSIWSKKTNSRYSEDMINMTIMAALSIAKRNAIFAVIPKFFTDTLYEEAKKKLRGELSDEKTLKTRRTKMFNYFKKDHNIEKEVILQYLSVSNEDEIDADMMVHMTQVVQGIKSGDVDPLVEFGIKKEVSEQKADEKIFGSKKQEQINFEDIPEGE